MRHRFATRRRWAARGSAIVGALLATSLLAPSGAAAPPVGSVVVHRDISYAPAEPAGSRGHLLDLYVPDQRGRSLRPLVIWTTGSGWFRDDGKDRAGPAAEFFTAKGYVVAGVSVRSSPQAKFPAQVHDIKAAIRWLRANAHAYRIDPNRFAILGDSSGGWVSSMAAVTGDVPALEGTVGVTGVSSSVQAAVDFFGPTDFLSATESMLPGACDAFNAMFRLTGCHDDPGSPESQLLGCPIQECPALARAADPSRYVSRADPAMMILHGQADTIIPEPQSELLYEALRAKCVTATFFSVPGVGHNPAHPYLTDPDAAEGQTVTSGRGCHRDRVTVDRPDPTWETIERFLRVELRRARPCTTRT